METTVIDTFQARSLNSLIGPLVKYDDEAYARIPLPREFAFDLSGPKQPKNLLVDGPGIYHGRFTSDGFSFARYISPKVTEMVILG